LDHVPSSLLSNLFPKQFEHLENLELKNLGVSLDKLLKMTLRLSRKTPLKIRSVVCRGLCEAAIVPTRGQAELIRKLREMPACRVECRLTNRVEFYYDGVFHFDFKRS
jgi:hypothetical protein